LGRKSFLEPLEDEPLGSEDLKYAEVVMRYIPKSTLQVKKMRNNFKVACHRSDIT
jgi:hypothetical protein